MREFELIGQVFRQADYARAGGSVVQSIGDDCAILNVAAGQQLVVSTDSLLEGVHFPLDAPPRLLGQRVLAVSVSDLAAMGATPLGFTLALSMPSASAQWLHELSMGLREVALACGLRLIGGDTTRGPLNLGITVMGTVATGQALLRSGARVGDQLWVSGELGAAAAALPLLAGEIQADSVIADRLLASYWTPAPRLALGQWLLGKAGAALDVSDGLLADAGHIAAESAVQLVIEQSLVPVSASARQFDAGRALEWALSGGDDYQLLFSLPAQFAGQLQQEFPSARRIGMVKAGSGVVLLDGQGRQLEAASCGYQHF